MNNKTDEIVKDIRNSKEFSKMIKWISGGFLFVFLFILFLGLS